MGKPSTINYKMFEKLCLSLEITRTSKLKKNKQILENKNLKLKVCIFKNLAILCIHAYLIDMID